MKYRGEAQTSSWINWNETPCSIIVMKQRVINKHSSVILIYAICLLLDRKCQAGISCSVPIRPPAKNLVQPGGGKKKQSFSEAAKWALHNGISSLVRAPHRLSPIPEEGISKEHGQVRNPFVAWQFTPFLPAVKEEIKLSKCMSWSRLVCWVDIL